MQKEKSIDRKAENKKYPCIFKLTDDCPVKAEFKLQPENLRPWCEICPIRHEEIKEIEADIEAEQEKGYQTSNEKRSK